jgi:hypothetical protein
MSVTVTQIQNSEQLPETRPCQGPDCGVLITTTDSRVKYHNRTCQQRAYRERRGRKEYRPRQHGKRRDTEYIVFPAEVLDLALGETTAHSREQASREFQNGSPSPPIAIPARSVKTA